MLMPSCAPSVMPSTPRPENNPAVPERSTPGCIPERASKLVTIPAFIGPEMLRAKAAGNTESSAAAPAPNNRAVPGAVSPVSLWMFSNTSGALSA